MLVVMVEWTSVLLLETSSSRSALHPPYSLEHVSTASHQLPQPRPFSSALDTEVKCARDLPLATGSPEANARGDG